MVDPEEQVEVPSVGGRPPRRIARRVLCEIVEPRVDEIFMLVKRELQRSGYVDLLASGAVITGGTTIMDGMSELAEEVLGLPVRRGQPRNVGGLVDGVRRPRFSTGVGLVLHGAKVIDGNPYRQRRDRTGVSRRFKDWFAKVF